MVTSADLKVAGVQTECIDCGLLNSALVLTHSAVPCHAVKSSSGGERGGKHHFSNAHVKDPFGCQRRKRTRRGRGNEQHEVIYTSQVCAKQIKASTITFPMKIDPSGKVDTLSLHEIDCLSRPIAARLHPELKCARVQISANVRVGCMLPLFRVLAA